MAILNKYKRWVPMLMPINDEYWDVVLSQDDSPSYGVAAKLSENCLSSYIDFGNKECQDEEGVHSFSAYTWQECLEKNSESGITLDDIGYTGIDNGLIYYGGYDSVTNKEFYDIFTDSHITIPTGDCKLYLHKVTGNTGLYSYESEYVEDKYYALKGGFFQGFYKLFGFDYQILPQYIENEWNIEIQLRPRNYPEAENTLNSTHEGNKGLFFYMGTRAEDKFIRIYNTDLEGYETRVQPDREFCNGEYFSWEELPEDFIERAVAAGKIHRTVNILSAYNLSYFLNTYGYNWNSDCSCTISKTIDGIKESKKNICEKYLNDPDYYETDVEIIDSKVITSNGVPVEDSGYYEIKTDNKFLFFDRTCNGYTTANWDENTVIILTGSTNDLHNIKIPFIENGYSGYTNNLFLLMNRTCSGYTVDTIEEYYSQHKPEFNFTADTINNAFALKYNEDGSIGYRYMIYDCESGLTTIEENTYSGLVKENEWATVNVKFSILNGVIDDCGKPLKTRKMKIFIYINGYLKFISKELPEFNFRELNTVAEKQEGVPFNISVGGGTQGLCDSVWLDYEKAFPKILPIEEHFAGTFIGDIKSFKFYTCKLQQAQIMNNSLYNNIWQKTASAIIAQD